MGKMFLIPVSKNGKNYSAEACDRAFAEMIAMINKLEDEVRILRIKLNDPIFIRSDEKK